MSDHTIIEEALETVNSRSKERGTGFGTAERWAAIFGAMTGFPVLPEHYAFSGIATKLAREGEKPGKNRDNLVDTVGYVEVLDRIRNEQPKNNGIVCPPGDILPPTGSSMREGIS